MISIQLPDGSKREFPGPVTVAEVAARSAPGSPRRRSPAQARATARSSTPASCIERDTRLAIVTDRDPDGLEVIRHSTAHLLAYAVKELFPEAQVTIGPVIENGFYYDFAYKRPFTPEDLAAIEKRMTELAKKDEPVVRRVLPRDEAVAHFKGQGEHYKAEIIACIPPDEDVSLYREGGFDDLCRGPHVPSTGKLKDFKLMKVAGAYWRGDHRNEMLQRIYGTAWAKKEELQPTCTCWRRRKSATTAGSAASSTCSTSTRAPGLVFWHPKGWTLWQQVEQYMRARLPRQRLPGSEGPADPRPEPVGEDRPLGELPREHVHHGVGEPRLRAQADELPGPHPDLQQGIKSYRDLPLRYGEFGSCHRNEPSGALHGIMRVRGFTQDDGHIFCTEDQILDECVAFTALLQKVYADFGFADIIYKVATRPDKRIGADASLGQGRAALMECLRRSGCDFEISPGRRGLLRPEDRVLAEGRDRPAVAVRHHPGRLLHARAARRRVRRRGQRARRAGDAAPRDRRLHGALHRHPDRAPCRRVAGLAGAGAGGGADDHRAPGRLRARAWPKRCKNKELGSRAICATRKLPIKYASIRCRSSRTSWSLATRRRQAGPLPCARGAIRISA